MTIKKEYVSKTGIVFTLEFPAKRAICPTCDGKGKHVNRAIDSHGISPEEFQQDPDFAESYFSGVFDVTCEQCKGEKIIEVGDKKRFTKRQKFIWDTIQENDHREHQLAEMELRYGY